MVVNEIGHIKLWSANRLPNEYQEVEWIASSGSNCGINTLISPKDSPYFRVQFKMNPTTLKSSGNYFYGAGSTPRCSFEVCPNAYRNAGNTTVFGTHTISAGNDYEYDVTYSNGTFTCVGNAYNATHSYSNSTLGTGNFMFFCGSSNLDSQSAEKLYYLKLYQGDGLPLVRDFVPCYRKSDNVIGLYDLVTKSFFVNAGSGIFTKGSNINTPGYIDAGHAYIGQTLVRPHIRSWEFSYDFRNGSLTGFQAAGGNNIETNGSYSITSNGLQQTNGSNDRRETAWVNIPDISGASNITIESLGYYRAASWSNNKRVMITDNNSRSTSSNNRLIGQMAMNTSSPSRYNSYGIWGFGVDKVREYINGAQGDTTQNLNINLQTGLVTYTNTGANTKNYTYTMSSSELATLKTRRWVGFEKERGYSSYNDEALKTIGITIYY